MLQSPAMRRYSVYVLVLANLVPVFGVLFLHWSLFSIMFFYWLESGVVGLYNVPKLIMARPDPKPVSTSQESDSQASLKTRGKAFFVGFFLLHYGIFMLAHGLFVYFFFGPPDLNAETALIGLISLGLSHGASFVVNYIGRREYTKVTVSQQMLAPYKRIVIMHVAIILGGFLIGLFGAPVVAVLFIVVLKMAIDVPIHVREHTKLGTFISQMRAITDFERPVGPT